MGQHFADVRIFPERAVRNADADRHIGCYALIKHMRNLKVVYFLADTLSCGLRLLWIDGGQ